MKNNPFYSLFIFSIILFLVNLGMLYFLKWMPISWIWYIHIFFLILSFGLIYIFNWIAHNFIEKSGFVFIGFLFVKIILIFSYLTILKKVIFFTNSFVGNFGIAYLLYLFFSMLSCYKILLSCQKNKP